MNSTTSVLTTSPVLAEEVKVTVSEAAAAPSRRMRAEYVVLTLATGLTAWLYSSTIVGLVMQWWKDPNYGHAFFALPFAIYVAYRKKDALSRAPIKPSNWGIVVVLFALALLFVGTLGAELFFARISLLLFVLGAVLYCAGTSVVRILAFAFVVCLFMVPMPAVIFNQITFPMQLLASRLATGVLDLTNFVPIVREGNLLILPNITLEVVEACSGIRSFVSLIMLATVYGYFVERSRIMRAVLILAMLPLAILSNAFRVIVTVILAYRWPESSEGLSHSLEGWTIFVVALTAMILMHACLKGGVRLVQHLRGAA